MQRVLITGAGGFAGHHLRSALEMRGIETMASTADVRDGAGLASEVEATRPDAVAHLAALATVAGTWDREREVWEVNAIGTLNVVASRPASTHPRRGSWPCRQRRSTGLSQTPKDPSTRAGRPRHLSLRPLQGGCGDRLRAP